MTTFPHLIANERVHSSASMANINPSDTNDTIGEYAIGTADDVAAAVDAAMSAKSVWGETPLLERAEILQRAADEVASRHGELSDLLAREEGKTRVEAGGEITRTAQLLTFHSGQITRNVGESLASTRPGLEVTVTREPVGVVGIITPWNFPSAIPTWKIAPALAYGNTVVFKPAELVPGSAWHLVDILQRAGLPAGVLNMVMGHGAEVGSSIASAPGVDAISFTGSVATGQRVLEAAMPRHAKVQLEMGGKNPLIIADDAAIDVAVRVAMDSAFGATGQRCTAASRLIVMTDIHDEFVNRLTAAMDDVVVGDARAEGVTMGPAVDQRQLDQNQRYLSTARSEGGDVIGGELLERPTPGFYMAPAVVLGTRNDMTINREEVFGPVAAVQVADDFDHAVHLANDTQFGLSSGIVTKSLARSQHFRKASKAGMVMVNTPTAGVDFHAPFGGRGASSYGSREQGRAAQDFFTTIKTAYIDPGVAS